MISNKATVCDFFFHKTVIIKTVWKWINWQWMARFRILDQTSHSHVQFRKRHVIHVHWTGNGPEWRRCFVGINFLRGNNHIARPKSSKYMFTKRLAISLAYSSFGFKLGFFPCVTKTNSALNLSWSQQEKHANLGCGSLQAKRSVYSWKGTWYIIET